MSELVAKITLAYDGRDFHGWQIQPDQRTVQGTLMDKLGRLVELGGIPPGAGRTDAGVHATGQVSSVPLRDPTQLERLREALPRMVPEDMAIVAIEPAPVGFHARFSATGRRYRYRMLRRRDPFRRSSHFRPHGPLDVGAMREAAAALAGAHDCDSFCVKSSLEPGRTRCELREVQLLEPAPDELALVIEADRFLHSMVRTIVGTLVEVGRGQRPAGCIPAILAARDREAAGFTAPPHGLVLEAVRYPD